MLDKKGRKQVFYNHINIKRRREEIVPIAIPLTTILLT